MAIRNPNPNPNPNPRFPHLQRQQQLAVFFVVFFFFFCCCLAVARVQSSPHARCRGLAQQLLPCAAYTSRLQPSQIPSQDCCDTFNSTSVPCLCALITGYGRPIARFDRDRALGIPHACNLTALQARLDSIFQDCYNEGAAGGF